MCTSPLFRHPVDVYQSGKAKIYGLVDYENFGVTDPFYQRELQRIPCGQCMECRLQRAKEWSYRIMLEAQEFAPEECWFITLTYDEDHLDSSYYREYIETSTGEVTWRPALRSKDHQDFMKRLRKAADEAGNQKKLRFFACGEYGSETLRPHFHSIVFGLELFTPSLMSSGKDPRRQLKVYKQRIDHPLYNCDWLTNVWGKGFVTVSPLSADTAAYCARYCTKKKLGLHYEEETKAQDLIDQPPFPREFIVMSRKPGIARNYFDQNSADIFLCDAIPLNVKERLELVKPFRYYDKLYDLEDELDMACIKAKRRQAAEAAHAAAQQLSSKSERERLRDKAENLTKRLKRLPRNEL